MSGSSLVGVPIVNAETATFKGLGQEFVLNGATYVAAAVVVMIGTSAWATGNPAPVNDAAAITQLTSIAASDALIATNAGSIAALDALIATNTGSVVTNTSSMVAELASIGTQLAGTIHTASSPLGPLAYQASTSATVTTASGPLVNAGTYTRSLILTTDLLSTSDVYLDPSGGAAVVGAGIPLGAGGDQVTFGSSDMPIPTGTITAIARSGTVLVTVAGG